MRNLIKKITLLEELNSILFTKKNRDYRVGSPKNEDISTSKLILNIASLLLILPIITAILLLLLFEFK